LEAPITAVQSVSRFPFTRRDLALLVPVACSAEAILHTIRSVSPWVQSCGIFDVYQGKGIAPGKKSLGVSVVIEDRHQTLTLEAVDTCMTAVMQRLIEEHAVEQRG
jgi:phenylalanyl-tRNA synthetase beta chain